MQKLIWIWDIQCLWVRIFLSLGKLSTWSKEIICKMRFICLAVLTTQLDAWLLGNLSKQAYSRSISVQAAVSQHQNHTGNRSDSITVSQLLWFSRDYVQVQNKLKLHFIKNETPSEDKRPQKLWQHWLFVCPSSANECHRKSFHFTRRHEWMKTPSQFHITTWHLWKKKKNKLMTPRTNNQSKKEKQMTNSDNFWSDRQFYIIAVNDEVGLCSKVPDLKETRSVKLTHSVTERMTKRGW